MPIIQCKVVTLLEFQDYNKEQVTYNVGNGTPFQERQPSQHTPDAASPNMLNTGRTFANHEAVDTSKTTAALQPSLRRRVSKSPLVLHQLDFQRTLNMTDMTSLQKQFR